MELEALTNRTCQKCVNFLEDDNGYTECDFEYFTNIKYDISILYVPDMFECNEHEIID